MSTAVVFTDEQLRAQAVADALALFNGVRKRCHDFEELQGVFEAIDRAAQEEAARQEAAQRAQAKRPKRRRAAQPRA
jgi:UDP-N-acetylmuramate-alanine ligase